MPTSLHDTGKRVSMVPYTNALGFLYEHAIGALVSLDLLSVCLSICLPVCLSGISSAIYRPIGTKLCMQVGHGPRKHIRLKL